MQTFKKSERLTGFGVIRSLFKGGYILYLPPFRATWMPGPSGPDQPVKILLSVPKHNLRKATERNLVRRRMKEAYRKNKEILYTPLNEGGRQMLLCITYNCREILPSNEIRDKIILLLQRLLKENEKVTC